MTKENIKIYNNNVMLTFLVLFLLGACLFGGIHFVRADEAINYEKSFVSIEIQNGDTLTSIAREYATSEAEYQDYIKELKDINNLSGDTIQSGCFLLVPVYSVID